MLKERTTSMVSHAACIEAVGRICGSFRIDSLLPRLEACEEAMRDDGVVDVAVLGQFKAGKSSFLNSVIGKSVMPVGVLPATTVVTRIGYGAEDGATVLRGSGEAEAISLARLSEFVTEEGNPENGKNVRMVEAKVSSLKSFDGIRFVDTPGLGSLFTWNTSTSLEWLPRVGAAIVAVGIDRPLAEQDISLIEQLRGHTPDVVILLTKADLVSEPQREEVAAFVRRQVGKRAGKDLPVFPFSIRQGFARLREPVEQYLLREVAGRRGEKHGEIVRHKVRMLLSACGEYLRLAQCAAEAEGEARGMLREALSMERVGMDLAGREIELLRRDLKSRLRSAAEERYRSFRAEVAGRLRSSLGEILPSWEGNLARASEGFREWLGDSLAKELERLVPAGEDRLAPLLDEALRSFSRTARAFQDRLSGHVRQALGASFSGVEFHAEVARPARPDVKVGRMFDIPLDLFWFLVPMAVFGPFIRTHYFRRIPWEVEKNLSRLAAQWAEAADRSIDRLCRETMDFMRDELETIEGLVSGPEGRLGEIRKAFGELASLESGLLDAPESPGQQV